MGRAHKAERSGVLFKVTRYRIGLLLGLAALLVFPLANSFASPTGYEIDPKFHAYYEQSGGLPVFGYAVSEPVEEDGRLVQYLERQRLELHPEFAGTPYEVLLGHLGLEDAQRRGLTNDDAFQPRTSGDGDGEFFEETGHNLGGIFLDYWQSNGLNFGDSGVSLRESLALFGYPISEEFVDPETGLTTQYFERARFEHHPEHSGTDYEVLLGHLGNSEMEFQRANGRGPGGDGPPGQNNNNDEQEQSDSGSGNEDVTPSTSIQQMVDNASSGATVTVPAGIYRETVTINKPVTLVAEPGAEIRGDDENGNIVREYWIVGRSSDVTIDGFTMKYAANRTQTGAINNGGHDNWTIQNNVLSHASGANVSISQASNLKLLNNEISHAGQLGVHGYQGRNVVIEGNRIHSNNTDGYDWSWEAGGLKLAEANGVTITGNESFNNVGPGLWCDIDCANIAFQNNRVHHNTAPGIIYELSRDGQIIGNSVWENGHASTEGPGRSGIFIQNSSDTMVADNVVAWNGAGIVVWSEDRGETRWNNVTGNAVRDNAVFIKATRQWDEFGLAWIEFGHTNGMANDASNNRGSNNSYYHANADSASYNTFMYVDQNFNWDQLSGFNETYGESNGRQLSESQKNQVLDSAGVPRSSER